MIKCLNSRTTKSVCLQVSVTRGSTVLTNNAKGEIYAVCLTAATRTYPKIQLLHFQEGSEI